MAGCLSDALADGWAPQEVRFVLFDKAVRLIFEPAFCAVFEGSGGTVG
jgi:hypothetical protein